MPSPARTRALAILLDLPRNRGTLAEQFAAADAELPEARERAFLRELVLGSLRARGRLDHALTALIDRPLARVDPAALEALRLGAYQMLELRVPDRAAVSESVDLARTAAPASGGFVNAVLRRLGREGAAPLPDPVGDPLAWLTSGGSLPAWLAERWLARLGPERAVARARELLSPPATVLRLNPRVPDAAARATAAGLALRPLEVPGAFEATGAPATALSEAGVVYAQDEGSQLVARLATHPGRILDACAAPGGKASLMADAGPDRTVYALEPARKRRDAMRRLLDRWGAPNIRMVAADANRPPFAGAPFDTVLLDAPCSGLGTLARHPDIRWRTSASDLQRHAALQSRLLRSTAPLVRSGGRLVYATCSSEPEENEGVVTAFLAEAPAFRIEPLPAWAAVFADGPFARSGSRGGDSFFAALLRRT